VAQLYFSIVDASIISEADRAMGSEIRFEAWYGRFNRLAGDLYPGRYSREYVRDLVETAQEITALARRKGSLIVAHNYVYPELQEVAEAVGDSLGLSLLVGKRKAARVDFCGVWFMGETAKMILGDRSKVYMPDRPGCSLVAAIDHRRISDWIARHPDGVVVAYVNTDAHTKAMSHYLCTSANAAPVLEHVARKHPGRRILFLPDKYLGAAALATARLDANLVDLYDGACHVHARIGKEVIEDALAQHPGAELLIHPECACSAERKKGVAPPNNGHFLSSEQMLRYATTSAADEFIVATEKGLVYRLRRECPTKRFYPISDAALCEYMKMNTLEKLCDSLRHDQFEVEVDHDISNRARGAITRMLSIH
jgi:quinolinate synthase